MNKKTAIILFAVLSAASVYTIMKLPPNQRPEFVPMRAEMRDVLYSETDEASGPVGGGETDADEPAAQTDPNGDKELKLAENTDENTEILPESTGFLYGSPAALRSFLLPGEAVVTNFQELKSALEDDNGITAVYFGGDITMQLSGIKINPKKQQIVISGLNPLDPDRLEPYTLTDYSSASFYSTIYVDAVGISTLTVRDMNIVGKNYYGPFSVYDSSAFAGVLLIYERVNYNGPQLCYHRKGTIHVKDCTVRIHGGNGGSLNQEFSETKHLVFKGSNTIHTESNSYSVFWHPEGGTFTLSDDSSLIVTSPNTSALYGVFFADLPSYKVSIAIGERANLDMTISGDAAPDAYVTISGLTVGEAGKFSLKTTKAGSRALRVSGALTVEKEASFIISGFGGSGASSSLLRQEGGDITIMKDATFRLTGQAAYSSLLNLAGRAFLCDDPASVLFYNASRDISAATNPARIYIDAQQVNFWDTTDAGGLDLPALYKWDKPDGSNFLIDGTLSAGANGEFTDISSNYVSGDPPGKAPDKTTFSMESARVLAFGRLELIIYQPTVKSEAINGVTKPGAVVRASFSQGGESYILPDTIADSMGVFHIPLDIALDEDTVVTVKGSWQFLTASAEAVTRGEGKLELSVPDSMEFFISGISPRAQIIKRLHTGWEIVVSDGRDAGGKWSVFARLGSEMTPDKPELPALAGALIYIDGSGAETVIGTGADVLISSHTSFYDEEVFPISWDEDKGILLFVKPGAVFADTKYKTSILWTLINAP